MPDGDLFKAIRAQRASVVTDQIASFTETGLKLASGAELPADLVVTATGLKLKVVGGIELLVDGRKLEPAELVNYKGIMFAGVPNFASVFGYTNASWTLKADLTATFVCRLLNHMQKTGARRCVAMADDPDMPLRPWVDFSSGYFQRALDRLLKQGEKKPWKLNQNYLSDFFTLRYGAVDDGVMRFSAQHLQSQVSVRSSERPCGARRECLDGEHVDIHKIKVAIAPPNTKLYGNALLGGPQLTGGSTSCVTAGKSCVSPVHRCAKC